MASLAIFFDSLDLMSLGKAFDMTVPLKVGAFLRVLVLGLGLKADFGLVLLVEAMV